MGRKKKKKTQGIKWLNLLLELLVVFAGVTAGFILNNFREESVSGESEKIYLGSIGFRNLTAGYYMVENQKMQMSITLDSLNIQLKNRLITLLNSN